MSFEERLNAGSEYEAAQKDFAAAKELLDEEGADSPSHEDSEEKAIARAMFDEEYARTGEAEMNFREVLLKSKDEVTPELVLEAYEGYSKVLREKMVAAATRNDILMMEEVLGKLKELERVHAHDERILSEVVRENILELFDEKGVHDERMRKTLMNHAEYLVAKKGEKPEALPSILKREIDAPPLVKRIPPGWTGHRKPRNAQ